VNPLVDDDARTYPKNMRRIHALMLFVAACGSLFQPASACSQEAKDPVVLLRLPGDLTDPEMIDHDKLPRLKGTHVVISPKDDEWKFQLHNYLLHHDGRFWCMWSHGPAEDMPPQHIRFSTSVDGKTWSPSQVLVGPPKEGYAYIARGFWVRDGELLALVAHFKGRGAFGVNKELELQAYVWDKANAVWKLKGRVYENAINSFPPQKLPTGEWMLTRRDSRFNTSMLIGGIKALDDWRSFPVVKSLQIKGFSPDEPHWYEIPGNKLLALIRDNGGSGRLYHSVSADNGQTWSTPVVSNFPNATSKFFSIRTSKGYRVLVSNANPKIGRRQMHLSISGDGVVYTRMALLDIPMPKAATLQYPHVMEHEGDLLIAFSRTKQMIEMLRIPLSELDALREE